MKKNSNDIASFAPSEATSLPMLLHALSHFH